MAILPRISVVTCSYNQGRFLGRTIESVLAQDYPAVEHIVVDGLSTDETPEVLARYPHLRVVREADSGQAEAINKGFRLATGDIFCFLNSDDTLAAGALHRVAREIDPGCGRHVVLGRCIHIDEDDRTLPFEHPSAFFGHERVLKVWKGHWIPQPATFWTRAAWRQCGPLDEREHLVLDFDLMCRLSRRYAFTFIDEVLAAYRLHTHSKSCSNTAEHIYARAIRVSRRYWGSPLRPRYWRLLCSLAGHRLEERFGRKARAATLAVTGRHLRAAGQRLRGLAHQALAAVLAPKVALRRALLLARGRQRGGSWEDASLSPLTRIWRHFNAAHGDGHVGPSFVTPFETAPGQRWLHLDGTAVLGWLPLPATLDIHIDGVPAGRFALPQRGSFSLPLPVAGLSCGRHELTVTCDSFLVLDDYLGNTDFRPLAFHLIGLRPEAAAATRAAG